VTPAASQLTIGQLARETHISATTVRYYERIGLLMPDDRSRGNYRLYGQASLRRLKFIRAAQSIGFTLDDVKVLLGSRGDMAPSCREVQTRIEDRLSDIEGRLQDLHHIRRVLKSSLEKCKKGDQVGCCHVVESLHRKS
jgi:DNA-binding transcriptional MerR regulator